jgi:hypothetical protein
MSATQAVVLSYSSTRIRKLLEPVSQDQEGVRRLWSWFGVLRNEYMETLRSAYPQRIEEEQQIHCRLRLENLREAIERIEERVDARQAGSTVLTSYGLDPRPSQL